MAQVAIVFFSGYGHTAKQADAVAAGAEAVTPTVMLRIDEHGDLPASGWDTILQSRAVVFGSPTYMGGPAWQFKKFADASSKPWFQMLWKDKLAAGFTNSASINGDKGSTISYLVTLAMQHGMIWIGTALMPANQKASQRNDVNWLAGFSGALAQSPSDGSPEEGPLPGDLETARLLGRRIAELATK